MAAARLRIHFILAVAAVSFLAVAAVAIDAIRQNEYVYSTVQYYDICILWDETDNVRLPPDENVQNLIHGTVRYWASLSPR